MKFLVQGSRDSAFGGFEEAGAASRAGRRFLLLLGNLGDERFGGEQERRDRRRVLQRRAHDLGRVDDAGLDQVLVLVGAAL